LEVLRGSSIVKRSILSISVKEYTHYFRKHTKNCLFQRRPTRRRVTRRRLKRRKLSCDEGIERNVLKKMEEKKEESKEDAEK